MARLIRPVALAGLSVFALAKLSDSQLKHQLSITRKVSNWWGNVMKKEIPESIRVPLLRLYAKVTAINQEEMAEPMEAYKSITELFVRPLKTGVRPISEQELISPCDSRVLTFGEVKNDTVESVKGRTYHISDLLFGRKPIDTTEHSQSLVKHPGNKLYYVTFYLSPADHHRFYSPFHWTIHRRLHHYGYLIGVFPLNLWRRNIYDVNERVVYTGEWQHGFASFVAVGAYNVGAIEMKCDPEVETNKQDFAGVPSHGIVTKDFRSGEEAGMHVEKGEELGRFKYGSTIVLVFEAPADHYRFCLGYKEKVKLGQSIIQ